MISSVKINFMWMLAANVIYSFFQWLSVPLIGRLTNWETLGVFVLGISVNSPIFIFSWLQLRAIQATDSTQRYPFGLYMYARCLTTCVAFLLVLSVGVVSITDANTFDVVMSLSIVKIIESLSDIIYGRFQREEEMDLIAKSMILRSVASQTGFILTLYFSKSLVSSIAVMTLISLMVLLRYDTYNLLHSLKKNVGAEWNSLKNLIIRLIDISSGRNGQLLTLIWLGLPMGLHGFLFTLKPNIPRYVLQYFSGERDLGIFAAIVSVTMVGNTIVNAIGTAVLPPLSRSFMEKNKSSIRSWVIRLISFSFLIGTSGLLASIYFGREIMFFLYGYESGDAIQALPVVMFGALIANMSSMLAIALIASQNFWILVPVYGSVCLVNLATSTGLTAIYGLWGSIYGTVVTETIQFAGLCWAFKHSSK